MAGGPRRMPRFECAEEKQCLFVGKKLSYNVDISSFDSIGFDLFDQHWDDKSNNNVSL